MLEHILALVLSGASSPWGASELAAHTRTLQLDVNGRPSAACESVRLDVPVNEGGMIFFEDRGIQYEGAEAPNGMIVLRSEGERRLMLSGDHRSGGQWSRGADGVCTGSWHAVP
jgi:hypothetical protein